MTLQDLVKNMARWLDCSGEKSDIVVSSRVRLARNIRSIPFAHRATDSQQRLVIDKVLDANAKTDCLADASFYNTGELSDLDRQILVERHLISPALAEQRGQWGVLVGVDESLSVMINEEDHLRIQVIVSGFQPQRAWELCDRADAELSQSLDYSFSRKLGYHTACPTNLGTGLRASMLIHLPGLVLTQDMDKVVRGITQLGFTARGFYGEGTEVMGNLVQVSNQVTLGISEKEILDDLETVCSQVVEYEHLSREALLKEAKHQIEDKIWRAYTILQNARVLTTQEFMNMASAVRLGCSMGILSKRNSRFIVRLLNELMVTTQPSHLHKATGKCMEPSERDILRAKIVRERLVRGRNKSS